MLRSADSSDSGLKNQFPKRLKTLASNVTFSEGNHLLHQFVLDNSSPNDLGSENYINAVLLSMCDTSVSALNNEGYCAIHLAVLKNNVLMVTKMLSCFETLQVNIKDKYNNTALHLATHAGHVPIMQELLNNGADVNAQSGFYKRTPLHLAVQGDHFNLDVITLLMERGANVNAQDEDNNTALHLATKACHVPIMQELLNNGADVNAQGCDDRTPLHFAVQGDHLKLDVGTLLLERGANVNAQDEDNNTALHLATKVGHVQIMQELLNNYTDVNALSGFYKRTPLHLAVQGDHLKLDVVTLLLERGANVNAQDKCGNSASHLAAKTGHVLIMQELLNNGADVNALNRYNNRTPLHLAFEGDALNLDIIMLLLERGANINAKDTFNSTALHLATEVGHVPIMQELLNKGADVNAQCGVYNQTPLHLALQGDNTNLDIITLLLDRGANVNAKDGDRKTALHFVTNASSHVPIMFRLQMLNNSADVNARGNNRTPLHLALQGDNLNLDIITLLLERGANVNAQDEGNDTALHLATKAGHLPIMQELLNNGADVNAQGGYFNRTTPLHLAFQGDNLNLDIIMLLLERGADVNAQDIINYTALHLATKAGHVLIIQELLNNGADVNAQGGYYKRTTPLHSAFQGDNLNVDIITLLLERGANVNAQDVDNDTALHLATKAGHIPIMQELLNNGADVNAQGKYSKTPLQLAKEVGNLSVCEVLCG